VSDSNSCLCHCVCVCVVCVCVCLTFSKKNTSHTPGRGRTLGATGGHLGKELHGRHGSSLEERARFESRLSVGQLFISVCEATVPILWRFRLARVSVYGYLITNADGECIFVLSSVCVCTCVCVCVCVLRMHAYMYVYLCMYVCVCVSMYARVCVCVCVYACAFTCVNMRMCVRMGICVYVYACVLHIIDERPAYHSAGGRVSKVAATVSAAEPGSTEVLCTAALLSTLTVELLRLWR
jgi:hypothetical protein